MAQRRSAKGEAAVPVSVSSTCFPMRFRRAARVNIVEVSGSLMATPRQFSFSDLRMATDNFHPSGIIDDDSLDFTVYRATLASGQEVRVTRVRKLDDGLENEQVRMELEVLSRVKHLNIVSLVGFCKEGREKLLVHQNLGYGTLSDHLHDNQESPLPWTRRLEIAEGIARGVAHLHGQKNPPLIHRNIKSSSILLDDKLVPMVLEVGLSKQMQQETSMTRGHGTMGYVPPENQSTGITTFTDKYDVYAFGVLLLEILTSRRAYDRRNAFHHEKEDLVNWMRLDVKKGGWKAFESVLDPAIRNENHKQEQEFLLNLALYCAEEDGNNRPAMRDVVVILECLRQSRSDR